MPPLLGSAFGARATHSPQALQLAQLQKCPIGLNEGAVDAEEELCCHRLSRWCPEHHLWPRRRNNSSTVNTGPNNQLRELPGHRGHHGAS